MQSYGRYRPFGVIPPFSLLIFHFFISRLIRPTSIVGVGPVIKANSRWPIGSVAAVSDAAAGGIHEDCDSANSLTGAPIREIMPF